LSSNIQVFQGIMCLFCFALWTDKDTDGTEEKHTGMEIVRKKHVSVLTNRQKVYQYALKAQGIPCKNRALLVTDTYKSL
jgi:hypothetical protein